MSLEQKLQSIINEYALRSDNKNVGSGMGGNLAYFVFLSDRKQVITPEVQNVEFRDNSVYWNPTFLEGSKKDVRQTLDEVLKTEVEKNNFTLNEQDFEAQNSFEPLVSDIFEGKVELPNISDMDTKTKLLLCKQLCQRFLTLPSDNFNYNIRTLSENLKKFDIGFVLYGVRTGLGIEFLVQNKLDENEDFNPLLQQISQALN